MLCKKKQEAPRRKKIHWMPGRYARKIPFDLHSYHHVKADVRPEISFPPPVILRPCFYGCLDAAWNKRKMYILVFIICFISGPLSWTDPATNHTLACLQGQNWSLAFQVIIKMCITGHPTLTSTPSLSVFCLISYISDPFMFHTASTPSGFGGPSQFADLSFSEIHFLALVLSLIYFVPLA